MRIWRRASAVLAFGLAAWATDVNSGAEPFGPARVIDGDTIAVQGETIRLHGIDAPEARQNCTRGAASHACGREATAALAALVDGETVRCRGIERDRYGRLVAKCDARGVDVSRRLVESGHAVAYRKYSHDYVPAESAAKRARRGLWADGVRFTLPSVERKNARSASVAPVRTASTGCAIKGNVSSKGSRIFHAPGQRDYDRTRISPAKGERWFCSEAEARAAGWRKARR